MTNYREILRQNAVGLNNSQIAVGLGISRTTVIKVLKNSEERGLSWETVQNLHEKEIARRLFPERERTLDYKQPDYEVVHKELAKSGVTLQLLWMEYCDECRANDEIPYQLTQFRKYYRDYVAKEKATMHIPRNPGEILEVDWAGQTAKIIDKDTGEEATAYIFVAGLAYSGYAYSEAFYRMDQDAWIAAHVHAYTYYGGSTKLLVPDNLKVGITKNTKDELVINAAYREMAEYYNTVILPARVRAPKDKPRVEGTVRLVEKGILAVYRNREFHSLGELNAAIREKLTSINSDSFQKKDGSRASLFEIEKPYLIPLPVNAFELSVWKKATVQFNYHVSIDYQNYSVPYEYIKKEVDVRLTGGTVEVFYEGNRICAHKRLYGKKYQYHTLPEHMPESHKQYLSWNGNRFRNWAEKIGPNTNIVINSLLTRYNVEQQSYKSCMALLKLADKYTSQRLEAACKMALTYTPQPFKHVQAILQSDKDLLQADTEESSVEQNVYGIMRGADYYGGGDDQ